MKKSKQLRIISVIISCIIIGIYLWLGSKVIFSVEEQNRNIIDHKKPKYVRGVHITGWIAGSKSRRSKINRLFEETELNTAVIDIKECEGEVYIPGVKLAKEYGTYVQAIPDIKDYIIELREKGVYTIARIVVFNDNLLSKKYPEFAIKNPEGALWENYRHMTWLDPYNEKNWDYNISIAEKAADIGFEEIQFDYIRFPSDGNLSKCCYSKVHTSSTAAAAIVEFLKQANRRLKPKGVNISIDVFGLTATVANDMGIGQKIVDMAKWVDYVSPMFYPSHSANGEYGIPEPIKDPYTTVFFSMYGATKRLGDSSKKLRPFLQDFSIKGYRYKKEEVRDQIQAVYDNDIGEWLLWNPRSVYTKSALKSKEFSDTFEKSDLYIAFKLKERFSKMRILAKPRKFEYKYMQEKEHIYPIYPGYHTMDECSVEVTIIDLEPPSNITGLSEKNSFGIKISTTNTEKK